MVSYIWIEGYRAYCRGSHICPYDDFTSQLKWICGFMDAVRDDNPGVYDKQFNEGIEAYADGVPLLSNPYANNTPDFFSWLTGWNKAHADFIKSCIELG